MRRVGLPLLLAVLGACKGGASSSEPADGTPDSNAAAVTWVEGASAMIPAGATIWLDAEGTREITLPLAMDRGGIAVRVLEGGSDRIAIETDPDNTCAAAGLAGLQLRLFVRAEALVAPPKARCPPVVAPPPRGVASVFGGSDVYWRDGTLAGKLPKVRDVFGTLIEAGERVCFPFAFAPGDELTLCFARGAVIRNDAIGLGGTGAVGSAIAEPVPEPPAGEVSALLGGDGMGGPHGGEVGGIIGVGIDGDLDGFGMLHAPRKPVPKVVQGKAKVSGKLDKDIVRRIVRAHINEVRFCYDKQLARTPELKGKITVAFTIGGDGSTSDVRVSESNLGDAELDACVVDRFTRWKFPKSSDGKPVTVIYPFTLDPGE